LAGPQIRLAIQISRHHAERELAREFRMAFQELADLKPERLIGSRRILRRAEVNQDQRLTFVNDVEFRVAFHPIGKIIQLFLERGLAVGILIEDVLVDAAEERNEFKASFELGPGGIEIAGVVANGLILQAEGRGTVWQVFLGEGLAVEDPAYRIRAVKPRTLGRGYKAR
jgi:hypothetical protein